MQLPNVTPGGGGPKDKVSLPECTVDGQLAKWSDTEQNWVCAIGDDTLGTLLCTNGQVAKFNGMVWQCVAGQGVPVPTCSDGQILKWNANSAAWDCADMPPTGQGGFDISFVRLAQQVRTDSSAFVPIPEMDLNITTTEPGTFIVTLTTDTSIVGGQQFLAEGVTALAISIDASFLSPGLPPRRDRENTDTSDLSWSVIAEDVAPGLHTVSLDLRCLTFSSSSCRDFGIEAAIQDDATLWVIHPR